MPGNQSDTRTVPPMLDPERSEALSLEERMSYAAMHMYYLRKDFDSFHQRVIADLADLDERMSHVELMLGEFTVRGPSIEFSKDD